MGVTATVERIRARGYWDVAVHPEPFQASRVPYEELDTILNQAVVRFRGWPLPFIDSRQKLMRHQDWIGQDIDARGLPHEEAWRFFTIARAGETSLSENRRFRSRAYPR